MTLTYFSFVVMTYDLMQSSRVQKQGACKRAAGLPCLTTVTAPDRLLPPRRSAAFVLLGDNYSIKVWQRSPQGQQVHMLTLSVCGGFILWSSHMAECQGVCVCLKWRCTTNCTFQSPLVEQFAPMGNNGNNQGQTVTIKKKTHRIYSHITGMWDIFKLFKA